MNHPDIQTIVSLLVRSLDQTKSETERRDLTIEALILTQRLAKD